MDKMKYVKIKDIGQVISGSTPSRDVSEYWNGNIPWVAPKEINKLQTPYLNKSAEMITESGLKSCSAKLLPKGSILFSSRAPIGLVAVTNIEVSTNQGFKSIVPNNDIDPLYIYYFLKSQTKQLNNLGTGTTFKELSKSVFENYKIPLPDTFSEQQKIATTLSKAEALIKQRKESIALLDEFLKSTFLEMFGDPVRNEKGWKINKLKKYFEVAPQNGLYKHSSMYGEGYRILRIDSFYNGAVIDLVKLKRVKLTQSEIDKYSLKQNDIIINRVNSRDYLGKVGLIPNLEEPLVFESNMMKFSVNESELNPIFLIKLLATKYVRNQIQKSAKDSVNQASINQQDVKNINIIVPPITLQNEFAQIVEKNEALKKQYQVSLEELEKLFGSLSQKAFIGKLDLSQVEVEEGEEEEEEENLDGGFVSIEEAEPIIKTLQKDIQSYLNSLPSIRSKAPEIIKEIKDLDVKKKQTGSIKFNENYAKYRILAPHFEIETPIIKESIPYRKKGSMRFSKRNGAVRHRLNGMHQISRRLKGGKGSEIIIPTRVSEIIIDKAERPRTFNEIYKYLEEFKDITYEQVRDFVFKGLTDEKPYFEQIFDTKTKEIRHKLLL